MSLSPVITSRTRVVASTAQFVAGMAIPFLVLYPFFLVNWGPGLLMSYYTNTLPNLPSDSTPFALVIILYGMSPFVTVLFLFAKHKYGRRNWMRSTQESFALGLMVGGLLVTLYIMLLLRSYSEWQCPYPCRDRGPGA